MGGGAPCYVIAEAGANHNRDLGRRARADRRGGRRGRGRGEVPDLLREHRSTRARRRGSSTSTTTARRRTSSRTSRCRATGRPSWPSTPRDRGIDFFSTPFDRDAVDELARAGRAGDEDRVVRDRRPAADPHAAATGVPLILSTGMATYGEIEDALRARRRVRATSEVALLRCASVYPAPPEIMNLRAMETMRAAFGVPVGLSDHTDGHRRARGRRRAGDGAAREALHARRGTWRAPTTRSRSSRTS